MGCLYHIGKYIIIYVAVFMAFVFFMVAFMVDFMLAANQKEPYFFDPDYIEAYDEPIFEGIEDELLSNYNQYAAAIKSVEREMAYLPDVRKLGVEFEEGSKVTLTAGYSGHYYVSTPYDYKAAENQERMMEIGITSDRLDKLKRKVEAANGISFLKDNALRLGFKEEKKGIFYYRFKSHSEEDLNSLLDSCLIQQLNDDILIEYIGKGRGPDCIKSNNPAGYDNRSLPKKMLDFIAHDHKTVFKDISPKK